ncbi:microcystin degradation protein MlrC [Aestuariivirga litoralis]|uniref:Microcystinase C n=1 Tax=Aestuariivirga litoralis TaxID=2650924 RepID=A0A2W2C9G3_9HYPH|nr:M81 family metallopeptidase [Aestuariivirga litoralis]PZF76803.1 microcystin degradation protein MlrC [Aestuariivirga litoralis]
MPRHVLTAEFAHESNTFKKGFTVLDDFRSETYLQGEAAIAERGNANTELAGFLDAAREAGWRVSHVISAHAGPGARVARAAFDDIAGQICAAATASRHSLDGILLSLHGAMVTEFCEDGEGELLTRLRAIVGPDMPIAVTLDLHANCTPLMCDLADAIVSYKTYPHIDMRERGLQAGRILEARMSGRSRPRTLRAHRPMLDEINSGRSDEGPMLPLYAKARAAEREPGILAVSINAGFSDADIRDVGPTVTVTYDTLQPAAESRARAIAEDIADGIWAARFTSVNTYLGVEEAAAIASSFDASRGPLIIADYADNPGSGAYGDATNLLRAMLDAGLRNAAFGPMIDPEAAAFLHTHRVGDTVSLALGGKNDPAFGGGPLAVTGEIIHLSNGDMICDGPILGGLHHSYGTTAVLRVDGIDVLVVTANSQMLDQQQFKAFGIMPAEKSVVALKSMQHFRAAFEPIAGRVIVCDSGALSTPRYERRTYRNVPRPIFPLERNTELPTRP